MPNEVEDEIENTLGSITKLKMLRVLSKNKNEYFTKYALEKMTGLKPMSVRSNLKDLTEIRWVIESPYKPTKYKINQENQTVKDLIDFFKKIKYI
jgi:Fic family protein